MLDHADLKGIIDKKGLGIQDILDDGVLVRHLPFVASVGDDVIMLRDGDVMASFLVRGVAAETAEPFTVEDLSSAMAGLAASLPSDIAIYVHRISSQVAPSLSEVPGHFPFAVEVNRRWQGRLDSSTLRERTTMVSLVVRPSKFSGMSWLFGVGEAERKTRIARRVERLNTAVTQFMEVLAMARPRRLTVSGGEWLGLFHAVLTGRKRLIAPHAMFRPLADLVASTGVVFEGESFFIPGGHEGEQRFGATLSIKDYPTTTFAGMFDGLNLAVDMTLTQSYTRGDPVASLSRIRRTIRQMSAADDAAISLRAQLVDAADDLASGRVGFGLHHCTATIFARSEEELGEAVGTATRVMQEAGGAITRESWGNRLGFFAAFPGNARYRGRAAMISSVNFGDMASLHAPPGGSAAGATPWVEPITVLPTSRGEPYRFNFHLAGNPGERTIGHSLVIGATGSGKTLTTLFLVAQAMRVSARIIAFDKDRGMEAGLRALGASYSAVRLGVPTGLNPFSAEVDDRGAAWLVDWLSAILGSDSPLSSLQVEALTRAVAANVTADSPALRTMRHFRSQLRSTEDSGDLHTRLGRWDSTGQYGWLFGGDREDSLNFSAQVTGFDLTEIFDTPAVRTAWLSYVFRRIERTVEDQYPTIIVLDEAWKLLDDPYFEARLKDWMLTMRKLNVVVILLTQRVSHFSESRAAGSILESTATRILFPNSRNTPEELAPLRLTDAESGFLQGSGVGHRMALIQSGDDSVIVDADLGGLGGLLGVLGGGAGNGLASGWRKNPDFWRGDSR